jgi:hypothetical protein
MITKGHEMKLWKRMYMTQSAMRNECNERLKTLKRGFDMDKEMFIDKIKAIRDMVESLETVFTEVFDSESKCNCVIKTTDVPGMCMIFPRRECQYHGKYHPSTRTRPQGCPGDECMKYVEQKKGQTNLFNTDEINSRGA